MHTHTHTHTYIYIYMHLHICGYEGISLYVLSIKNVR